MLRLADIKIIVDAVTYKPGWTITLGRENGKDLRPYIQVAVDETTEAAVGAHNGERAAWKGGKRYLSYHMCRQEVVGACLGAIKDAEMHELHEWFRYKGAAIFNPHLDPDVLVEVARKASSFNVRDNAMTMVEDDENPMCTDCNTQIGRDGCKCDLVEIDYAKMEPPVLRDIDPSGVQYGTVRTGRWSSDPRWHASSG